MVWEVYFAYLVTIAIFFASPPGPSQILMISNSMRHGVRRSLATMAGDLSANAIQMTAAAFGLAAVLATSQNALLAVKWLGVAYLIYVGLRTFFSKPKTLPAGRGAATAGQTGPRALFMQGFLTSASNPKAVFFFAALFPQFINANMAIGPQLLALGATYILVDGILLVTYGSAAERVAVHFKAHSSNLLNRVSGSLMIAAAMVLGLRDASVAPSAVR